MNELTQLLAELERFWELPESRRHEIATRIQTLWDQYPERNYPADVRAVIERFRRATHMAGGPLTDAKKQE
jgi:hypothetical protein